MRNRCFTPARRRRFYGECAKPLRILQQWRADVTCGLARRSATPVCCQGRPIRALATAQSSRLAQQYAVDSSRRVLRKLSKQRRTELRRISGTIRLLARLLSLCNIISFLHFKGSCGTDTEIELTPAIGSFYNQLLQLQSIWPQERPSESLALTCFLLKFQTTGNIFCPRTYEEMPRGERGTFIMRLKLR